MEEGIQEEVLAGQGGTEDAETAVDVRDVRPGDPLAEAAQPDAGRDERLPAELQSRGVESALAEDGDYGESAILVKEPGKFRNALSPHHEIHVRP